MDDGYYFDEHYREAVALGDGTAVLLRLVVASDKKLLAQGMERLSPKSRYYRFFAEIKRLSEKDLRYFTEMDNVNHFALGALRHVAQEHDDGIGVARFIRLTEQSDAAELAIAVLDEVQGKGLGSILLTRLIAAARERDIRYFRADILAENRPMQALIRKFGLDVRVTRTGNVLGYEFSLPPLAPDQPIPR